MKIMLVNDVPVGLAGSGGVEMHVHQLFQLLAERGHEPVLLMAQLPGRPAVHEPGRHEIPDLNAPPLRKRFLKNYREQSAALREAMAVVKAEAPDVIHVHNFMNPSALRLFRLLAPAVKSTHDCRPFCVKPYPVVASRLVGKSETFCDITFGARCWTRCYLHAGRTPIERIEAWSYFPANLRALRETDAFDRLIVYSEYLRGLALQHGTSTSKIALMHLFPPPGDERRATPPRDDPPVVLFAGRLSPEKGLRHLLEAAAQLPADLPFRLVIAGDGPMRGEVAERARMLRLSHPVELTGFLPRDEMRDWYQRASLVVFPSIGSEGCPLIGIEAMQCATPVVGFNVGGVGEWLVHRETGLAVSRGDIPGLASAMEFMLRNPAEREAMGLRGQALVRDRFDRDKHLDALLEVYREAIRARAAGETGGAP